MRISGRLRYAAGLLLLLCACRKTPEPTAVPPPTVRCAIAQEGEYFRTHEMIATVKPWRTVQLRARVGGFIAARHFSEGAMVKAGSVLYQIEPDSYRLAVRRAAAELARAEAAAANAVAEYRRVEALFKDKFASPRRHDDAIAAQLSTAANVLSARAALEQAQLELSYTEITAPFDGWIGLNQIDVHNFVAAPSPVLATLCDIDPVRVEFAVSDAYLAGSLLAALGNGDAPRWKVTLRFADGRIYGTVGKIAFWDNRVAMNTATLTMQALFENREHRLLPGLFVKVVLENPTPEKALLVDRAVLRYELDRAFTLVVTAEEQLEFRALTLGETVGEKVVVLAGLRAGERAVLTGNPLLRPGIRVRVMP